MARVAVIAPEGDTAQVVVDRLRKCSFVECCELTKPVNGADSCAGRDRVSPPELDSVDTVVYFPSWLADHRRTPDLPKARAVFDRCAHAGIKRLILLSSAAVYGASPHNPGLVSESYPVPRDGRNLIASEWRELEASARQRLALARNVELTILRPATVLSHVRANYVSQLLRSRVAITLPGHDPSLQLLHPDDVVNAICCAIQKAEGGVFNVAPDGAIPLRVALRWAGSKRIPVPRILQRLVRLGLARVGLAHPADQLEYVRYSWTASNKKSKRELGFKPRFSSAEALRAFIRERSQAPVESGDGSKLDFDDFGLDKEYIAAYGRTLFNFLSRYYWRIEMSGADHIPRSGRAVLAGIHRGFMPFDGVMALHGIVQATGRFPRFLIHPTLIKFPFQFNFMTKLGGIIACQENADYVLQHDELLGVFPEGIQGAFTLYREAYRVGDLFRDDFVRMALRNHSTIVPFVTVGSAEIFPILKRIRWRWWKRYTEWPFFPLTLTFPLLPLPLPSKWHTQFLPPLHVERQYPPEAANDAPTVRAISQTVRCQMQEAIDSMLKRRKSIFFGSLFKAEVS